MRHIIFVLFIISIAVLFGCSNSQSPITTGDNLSEGIPIGDYGYDSTINGKSYDFGNQTMIGAFQMIANHETSEIEVVPVNARAAMAHYNITSFLKEPTCPIAKCWYVNVLYHDPVEEIYYAEIAIYNPTSYTGYDVRVLFTELFDTDIDPETEELYTPNDIIIKNPDGWTKICDNEEEEPEMNPFILFNKEQYPTEMFPNPSRSFPPYSLDYEFVTLRYPSEAPAGPIYIILASFPDQAEEAIQFLHVEQIPPMDTSITGFSYVQCKIFDHQGEDPDMHVYLSVPDILGLDTNDDPIEVEFWEWNDGTPPERVFLGWEVRIENDEAETHPGDYPAMIRVETPNPNDFDTYFKFDFMVRHNTGSEGHTEYDAPIAYTGFESGDGEVYSSSNVFMRNIINATNQPDFLDIDPCWTKNAGFWYLYFASDSQEHLFAEPDEEDLDIYVILLQKVDNKIAVVPGSLACLTGNGFPGDERAPAIAPDGTFMVFQGQENENSDWEILKGALNPADPTYFSSTIQNLTDNGAEDENPTVNAHSNYILFDSDMNSGNEHDIFGMTATGADLRPILESPYNDTEPVFNPDMGINSNFFAFTREDGAGNCDIGRAELIDFNIVSLINLMSPKFENSDEKHASWSPAGTQLIFQSTRGDEGDYEIWSMDFNGDPYDKLTWNETDDLAPAWGPIP